MEATPEELQRIPDVGEVVGASISQFFREPGNREMIAKLRDAGLRLTSEPRKKPAQRLEDQGDDVGDHRNVEPAARRNRRGDYPARRESEWQREQENELRPRRGRGGEQIGESEAALASPSSTKTSFAACSRRFALRISRISYGGRFGAAQREASTGHRRLRYLGAVSRRSGTDDFLAGPSAIASGSLEVAWTVKVSFSSPRMTVIGTVSPALIKKEASITSSG